MLRLLLILLIHLSTSVARAQLAQSVRIEIPSDPAETEAFDVTPLGNRGVLMTIRTGGFFSNSASQFSFQKFDTSLKPLWQTKLKQDIQFQPLLSYHSQQYVYQLFREYDTNQFRFLKLNLEDGTMQSIDGILLDQFNVLGFKVMGSQAYVSGYRNHRPVVMAFSFFDGTAKVLPGLYANHLEISSLELDETRREVNVLIHSTRRRCSFSIRTYSYDSKLLRVVSFDKAANSLVSGKLLPVNDQESLLVGNYSTDCTPYSQGVYVTRIRHHQPDELPADVSAEAVKNMQYIEFSELQNFFNYLKPKRQEKLLAKAKRKKDEGKDYKFRYRLLVHDLLPSPDGFTLVAEVYYPQYRGGNLAYAGYLRGADRYDGFRYTHAFICGFDNSGKFLWDNCLPIKELFSPDLTEMVQLSQQDDRMILAYPNEGEITTEVIQKNKVLTRSENTKLQPNADDERITYSAQNNLMAWHDRHFLACGFQKIAPSGNLAKQREVFYLQKLTYDPAASPAKAAPATTRKNGGSGR